MTTRTARSQRTLDRAVEAAQERHARIHNAWIASLEEAERERQADAEVAATRRSHLHVVAVMDTFTIVMRGGARFRRTCTEGDAAAAFEGLTGGLYLVDSVGNLIAGDGRAYYATEGWGAAGPARPLPKTAKE